TTDTTVSLSARLAASRNARPDMFISIHANSMEDNVDISRVKGFSVWYREALAKQVSQTVYNNIISTLGRAETGVNNRNFYVTRGTWTPSFLIESGFVPNPEEFEWLTDDTQQTQYAQTLANSIVDYFYRK
ncbi:MAG: N-acetylmuramoyl-L-alanine amidase, partial [Clostridia bacterium]|nr:N-acetylmuramoyl-L-alanine amidase [Clostridia bacterium]